MIVDTNECEDCFKKKGRRVFTKFDKAAFSTGQCPLYRTVLACTCDKTGKVIPIIECN